MSLERFFRRCIAEQRRAIPKPGAGKKRNKPVIFPGDLIDKRRHRDYRAGPVIRYYLAEHIS